MDLIDAIQQSLTECFDFVLRTGWKGRERELVSLYAFSFLQRLCSPNAPLKDSGQIAIECAVQQVTAGGKARVCKDLLIWPEPHMTTWSSPDAAPLLIMEWKARGVNTVTDAAMERAVRGDIAWLQEYTTKHPITTGIAIGCNVAPDRQMMTAHLIVGGHVTEYWMRLGVR